jgi:phage baseplate assembly protein W
MPKQVGNDRWECLLEIKGLEKAHRHRVRGGDSLQALLLAIEEARCKLEEDGDRFVLVDIEPDYGSGLPRFIPTGMGPRFEQRIDIALERESRRVWEARFKNRKADIDACEKELKQRGKILAGLQASLERRKTVLADWDKDLNIAKARRRSKSA